MSTEKEYQEAFKSWVECQENQIKQIELNIQNCENMVAVHSEALELQKKSLKAEKEL